MRCRIIPLLSLFLLVLCLAPVHVQASGGDAASLVMQGDALLKTKNYTEALETYEMAIGLEMNNFNAWNGKADALNRAGNFNQALIASDTAISLDPKNPRGWINRGYILYNLGRYDDELKAYETAISLDPDNADAWFNKGYSLAGMKRYDEALAAFDKVQELRPDYPNLAQNRKIAEQLRASDVPVYIRYLPIFAGIILVISGIAGYLLFQKKSETDQENPENESRQSRRRKERQS